MIFRCLQRILNREGQDEYAGPISDRRDGWAMASSSTAAAQAALATRWGGRGRRPLPLASGAQQSALCDEDWLPMATIAAEFRPMVYNLWLLQSLGSRRDLATDPHRALSTTRAPKPKYGPRRLRRAVSIVNRLRRLTNQDPRVSTRVNRSTVGNDLGRYFRHDRLGGRQGKRGRFYRITPSMGRRTHLFA